ncbi:hypothetical protein XGA_2474 [Xanthomonas hortorum ATCC 19865]|nr:hypothetical protein XGA_2474 [Xanthomonas hortorum ATCC 19865]
MALSICACLHLLCSQLHAHARARGGVSPHADRRIALQYHMLLKQRMQQRCVGCMRDAW